VDVIWGGHRVYRPAAAACESRTAKEQNRTVPQGPPTPLMARPMSETYLPVAYRAVRTRAVEKSVTGARSSLPTTVNGRCSRRRATGGPRQPSLRAKTWQAVTAYSYRLTGVLFHCTTTTTTPVQRPRFQDNLGKPVPERQKQFGFKLGKRRCGFGMQWHRRVVHGLG